MKSARHRSRGKASKAISSGVCCLQIFFGLLIAFEAGAEDQTRPKVAAAVPPVTELLFKRQINVLLSLFVSKSIDSSEKALYEREGYALAFIYWANVFSASPSIPPCASVENHIFLMKKWITEVDESHLQDPLAIDEMGDITPRLVEISRGKGIPDAVVQDSNAYHTNVIAFKSWLSSLKRTR